MYIIHILGIRIGMPLVKQWYHMFELRRYAACFFAVHLVRFGAGNVDHFGATVTLFSDTAFG